jgi:uncharacterized protein YxeA
MKKILIIICSLLITNVALARLIKYKKKYNY